MTKIKLLPLEIDEKTFFKVCNDLIAIEVDAQHHKKKSEGLCDTLLLGVQTYKTPVEARRAFCIQNGMSFKTFDFELEKTITIEGKKMPSKLKTYFSQCVKAHKLLDEKFFKLQTWKDLKDAIQKEKTPYQIRVDEAVKLIKEATKTESVVAIDKLEKFVTTLE
jgi:hypothetical protein